MFEKNFGMCEVFQTSIGKSGVVLSTFQKRFIQSVRKKNSENNSLDFDKTGQKAWYENMRSTFNILSEQVSDRNQNEIVE